MVEEVYLVTEIDTTEVPVSIRRKTFEKQDDAEEWIEQELEKERFEDINELEKIDTYVYENSNHSQFGFEIITLEVE